MAGRMMGGRKDDGWKEGWMDGRWTEGWVEGMMDGWNDA